MAGSSWQATCQYCGRTSAIQTRTNETPPSTTPVITGKCPSHPSGNKDANHGPQWKRIK